MKRITFTIFTIFVSACAFASGLDSLRLSFAEAARFSVSSSVEVAQRFVNCSEQGRANDVLMLQLYTSVLLPDSEVRRLQELWSGDHFSDIDYSDKSLGRWQPSLHITRLQALAKLYSSPESHWYKDARLKEILHNGMGWWFRNRPVCPNWWHNEIGVPRKMAFLLIMLYDELTPEEIAGGVEVLNRSSFGRTGQNKVWLAQNLLMKALLIDDEALVLKARDTIAEEICISKNGEGVREDWSFHQHGPQMQLGNYGLAYLEGLSFLVRALEGSPYQFSAEQCSIVTSLMDKSTSWCVWKGVMDPNFCGRQCFPDAGRGKAYALAVAAANLAEYAAKMGDWALADKFRIIADRNLEPSKYANELVGAVWFPLSDCGCYRARNWYASVRMSSERIIGYEFTNNENTLAHFSALGAVLVMRTGDEYDNIFACWDWRKIPGVTSYDDGKPIKCDDSRRAKQNNSLNVGGSVHGDILDAHMEVSRDSLHAMKAVHISPDCIMEQGWDIYTLDPEVKAVTTAIDQVNLTGKVCRGKDGGNEWVWHNNVGYIALDGGHINISTEIQSGDWGVMDPSLKGRTDSRKIFKAWIDHPEALVKVGGRGSYRFMIVPDVDVQRLKAIAKRHASDHFIQTAITQMIALDARLSDVTMPRTYYQNTGKVEDVDLGWWCSGFFPGSLWYLYELSGDERIRYIADKNTHKLNGICSLYTQHDIGFQVNCSFGNAYRITGDTTCLHVLETAAGKLAARYSPVVGCIRSWDGHKKCHYPVIIDNMMNLELLMVGYELFGCDSLKQIAVSHANTTMANHYRPDFSCCHLVDYNPSTGAVDHKQTVQGYADESAWSRGQAWGLYGYTMMYEKTGDERYLLQAQHIAEYLLPILPKDGIPYWDFNAPGTPNAFDAGTKGNNALRDASAGAIMASAFVSLGRATSDKNLSSKYLDAARREIATLSSDEYLAKPMTNGNFLIKHSVGNLPGNGEVDVPLTYADYYLLEALVKLESLKK